MAISQTIKEKVFTDYERNRYETVVGQIQEYDDTCNRANVYMYDPKNGEQVLLYNVPVEMSGLGLISSGPFSGDQVYITFMNGSLLHPKIIGRADETFGYYSRSMTQHAKSGAYLSDNFGSSSFNGSSPSSSGSSASSSWIDSGSNSVGNYMNYTGNATSGVSSSASNSAYYRKAEAGLTHPLNRSTVKIRDNGVIDMFVGTNYGIRINPNDGSVSIISNGQSQHASSLSQYVDSSMNVQVGGTYSQSSSSSQITSSSGNISISSLNVSGNSANVKYSNMIENNINRTINATSVKMSANNYHQNVSAIKIDSESASYKANRVTRNYSSLTDSINDYVGKHSTYSVNTSSTFQIQAAKGGINSRGQFNIKTQDALKLEGLSTTLKAQQVNLEGIAAYLKATDFNIQGTAINMKASSEIIASGNKVNLSSSGEMALSGRIKATGDSFDITSTNVGIGTGSCGISLNGGTLTFSGAEFGGDFDKQVEEEIEKYFEKHLNEKMKAYFDSNFKKYFDAAHRNADHSKWMGGSTT